MPDPLSLLSGIRSIIEMADSDWKKERRATKARFQDEVSRAIADHHLEVSSWSQTAHHAFGVIDATADTVPLTLQSIPRRLGVGEREMNELDVLFAPSHIAVLGDPGAGKTTTLRRLAGHVVHEAPSTAEDLAKFAVLVVCRDQDWAQSDLYQVIGQKIGVAGKLYCDLDNPDLRIREVLSTGAIVVIDGLDEIPPDRRRALERSVVDLGRHLKGGQIVLSCRAADYISPLEGFEIAAIQPLSPEQIREVVESLLGADDAAAFYAALTAHSQAAELADRPLFLIQMVAIFKRRGTIPERPLDLYESLTRLILQEWDEQRGVQRVSQYASFGVEDKRRFLADLAYDLLSGGHIRFNEGDLANAYSRIAARYGLPGDEARRVARELESHTGLLVEVGDNYEFSHLSLQEYLAADSMVRGGSPRFGTWAGSLAPVAAIAVAISSDPNAWFHDLAATIPGASGSRALTPFLHRLGQEQPRFIEDTKLGHDFLVFLDRSGVDTEEALRQLGELKAVRKSIASALRRFQKIRSGTSTTRLSRYEDLNRPAVENLTLSTAPLEALVGREYLRQIINEGERSEPVDDASDGEVKSDLASHRLQ